MGRAIAITRTDISARKLRFIAKRTRDCRVVRRILAIALVLEGVDRATSARSSSMDRQTLRDWVHRYNCGGIAEPEWKGGGAYPSTFCAPGLEWDSETQKCRGALV